MSAFVDVSIKKSIVSIYSTCNSPSFLMSAVGFISGMIPLLLVAIAPVHFRKKE